MNRTIKFANVCFPALIALMLIIAAVPTVTTQAAPKNRHEFVFSGSPDPALNRFVSTAGVDTGDCSDFAQPCRTINYAINQSLAGDTIGVMEGVYIEPVHLLFF